MLDRDRRAAALVLQQQGHGTRAIAAALNVSRNTVKSILAAGSSDPTPVSRPTTYDAHVDRIQALFVSCRGNLIRVHEELRREGIAGSYTTLTRFCRARKIGVPSTERVGTWHFVPGEEMQHDTSPHKVEIGGTRRLLQCASLVLFHSRMRYCQVYPTFNRFYAKTFLSSALQFFGGAAGRCMIDNSSVILAGGSGKNAIISPEMEAFARRFGFTFEAHAIGYAERSARVERPFHDVEHNFYPGRTFGSLADCNAQLHQWCIDKNGAFRRTLHASPASLFLDERTVLRPLPLHIPEVTEVLFRVVDTLGYARLETNRYSVPDRLIGEKVEVLATSTRIRFVHRHDVVAEHVRAEPGANQTVRVAEHHTALRRTVRDARPNREALVLAAAGPAFSAMLDLLKRGRTRRNYLPAKRLHRMYLDYPTDALERVLQRAVAFGQDDLDRVERMVIRELATVFFLLPNETLTPGDTDDG